MSFWIIFISIMFLCFAPINIGGIRHRKLRLYVGIIILFVITAFRFDVGYDYEGYYHNLYPYFDYNSYKRLEPVGQFFMNISHMCKYPQLFFILYACITLYCLSHTFIKYSKSVFLSFLFYISFFYLPGLSTIRQEAAVSLILFAYPFLLKGNLIKYIIICLIATLFHTSAIIAIPIYFICRVRFNPIDEHTFKVIIVNSYIFSLLSLYRKF